MLSWASDKERFVEILIAEILLNFHPDDPRRSQSAFPSKIRLKLRIISVTYKLVKKFIIDLKA